MIDFLKGAGRAVVGAAASVATGVLVDPVTGVAVASGLLGGKVAKERGKNVEASTGRPVHKLTAPAAAVATPTAVMVLAQQLGYDLQPACEATASLLTVICGHPAATGVAAGLAAILTHELAGVTKAADRRNP